MKIIDFLHGTAIMHKNAFGRTREERVKQVLVGDESLYDFSSYIPVGHVVQKRQTWRRQGAEIISIVVKEFGGIDHLPDDLSALRVFNGTISKEVHHDQKSSDD